MRAKPQAVCRLTGSRFLEGALAGTGVDNLNPTAAAVEMHVAVDQGIECEIAALADPLAGVESIAHLADENVTGSHGLTTESLHATAL
jgi:hypothetical protein